VKIDLNEYVFNILMYIRNWRGKIVYLDVDKINNEKEYYSKLWKIMYNMNINVNINQKENIINYVNGKKYFI
tara:strand:- start:540 stop:755 length:216 start_codon:yes stop_codon:yes gene_type:complete